VEIGGTIPCEQDESRLEAEFKAERKLVLIPLHLCGPWLRLTLCQIPQLLGSGVPHRPCSEQELGLFFLRSLHKMAL
jgi:hypothetical protein